MIEVSIRTDTPFRRISSLSRPRVNAATNASPRAVRAAARPRPVAAAAVLAIGLVFVLLAGCATNTRGGSLERPLADYEDGQYEAANRSASAVMLRSNGRAHDEASYLSGLSAYRLGRLDEAEQRLSVAARSADPTTAANANATLGLVRLDQGRPAEAATLFKTAASHLDGEDADQAARYAEAAYRLAGEQSAMQRGASVATANTRANASYGFPAADRATPAQFAIQVGAFEDRRRAERAAADAGPVVSAAGLQGARIVPRTVDRGRRLYVVQFGRYRSRGEAAGARDRLGRLEYIVAPYVDAAR